MVSSLFVFLLIFCILSCSRKSVVNENSRDNLPISGSVADKAITQETKTDSMYYGAPPSPGGGASIPQPVSRKIIQNATVEVSVAVPEKTMEEIGKEVEKQKGYISSSYKKVYNNGTSATMQIKIPAIALKPFLKFLQTVGKMESENLSTNEITKEYFDTKARLDNAINQKKQFELILSKAQKIADLLEVQRQIDSVQERIEQFKGQITLWDQLVDLSTVDISIRQTEKAQAIENKPTWNVFSWKELGSLIKYSWISLAKVIVVIFQAILISIPYLLLLALLLWVIRVLIRKNNKSNTKK